MLALIQNCTPREEGKFVLLAHDGHFQTEQAQAELGRFIELARAEGFTFHTVDTFARTGAGETEGTTSGAGAFMPISLFAVLLSIVLSMKWMQ